MPARRKRVEPRRAVAPPPASPRDLDRFTGEGGANPPPASRRDDLERGPAPRTTREPKGPRPSTRR